MRGGSSTCNPVYPTTSSLNQGSQFADLTSKFHGGAKKKSSKSKMVRKTLRKRNTMKGGSYFTPYSDYPTAFSTMLPQDIRELARIAPLDAKFTELPAVEAAAGVMRGGSRNFANYSNSTFGSLLSKNAQVTANVLPINSPTKGGSKKGVSKRRGGASPINAPSMILQTQAEETAARLNPQWYTENTIVPNFRGPLPVPAGTVPVPKLGGSLKKKNRKTGRKFL